MVFVFVFGVVAAFAAPLLRRFGNAPSVCLAVGAAVLVLFSVIGLTHLDLRQGLAAVDANRREDLFSLACELAVLALGLFSLPWLKKILFCLGWGIHAAFTACVITAVIWLEFFLPWLT